MAQIGAMIGLPIALLLASAPADPRPPAQAQAELRASHNALSPDTDGSFLDGDPKAPALLDRHWAAIRRWTEAWLDANRPAAPRRLAAAAKAADRNLEVSALDIAPGVLAVSASENEIGTVFILRRTEDGFRTAWTASAPGRAALVGYPTLAGWSPGMARTSCRESGRTCGPLYGKLGSLPPQKNGRRRFYIDATYAQPAGATVGGQLSIWEWDGHEAKPLFADTYQYMIDQPYRVHVDRSILHVGVKGEFRTFFSCGQCSGRQMDWRIAVDEDGVRDLGRRDRVPELALADALLDRMFRRRPSPGVAPADLRLLRRQVAEADDERAFGMLMGWTLRRRGRVEELCLAGDADTDIFTFEKSAAGLRLLSMRKGSGSGCGNKAKS
ncbi:MAG: hypothetical protein QOH81_2736 [Sphingomonadales bacterium]|jgi:hypothetical protein|nr:hypothetical protein [Sphingomonadales bacterium]